MNYFEDVCLKCRVQITNRHTASRTGLKKLRVPQVWLAALRETDKQDPTEQHLICEDHFLPEDISKDGVSNDAIPIMPPCLDGPLGMSAPWGAETSEEEAEEEEEEEERWAVGGADVDEDIDDGGGDGAGVGGGEGGGGGEAPADVEPPAVDPPQQVRSSLLFGDFSVFILFVFLRV